MTRNVTRLLGLALVGLFAVAGLLPPQALAGDDWTQWRHDEHRSGVSTEVLPTSLYLQWRRDLPFASSEYVTDYFNPTQDTTVDYCRPVQLGKTLFVPVFASDRLTAYNTDTGAELWRFYASGALRRPPVAMALGGGTNVVIFGSDDGYVYCLNASNGSERWKFRAAPNANKAMGFGRLGSLWPVHASPVAYDGKVYFMAGVVPNMCIFAYCLDAATGTVVWRNDGRLSTVTGFLSASYPLVVSGDHTGIIETGIGEIPPYTLSALTGELASYNGSRFVDPKTITAGGKSYTAASMQALGVVGGANSVVSILTGDGKLFVTTTNGSLYCFGGTSNNTPTIYTNQVTPLTPVADAWTTAAQTMLSRADLKQGLALVWGVGSGRLAEELVKQAPELMIVAADPDPAKLLALRLKMDAAGIPAARFATVLGNPPDCGFAPYQAALIASEDATSMMGSGQALVEKLYTCTRPIGGEIWLATSSAEHAALAGWVAAANLPRCDVTQWPGFSGLGTDGFTQIRRLGLPDDKMEMRGPFRVVAFNNKSTRYGPGYYKAWDEDIYTGLPMTAPMIGYKPPLPRNTLGYGLWDGVPTVMNTLYSRAENFPAPAKGWLSCGGFEQSGETVWSHGKLAAFYNKVSYGGSLVFNEGYGCAGGFFDHFLGVARYSGDPCCGCHRWSRLLGVSYTLVATEDDENWFWYRDKPATFPYERTPIRRIGVNFGAVGDRYVPEDSMLWTHHPFNGMRERLTPTEAQPLVQVTYRGTWKAVYHHSAVMEKTSPRYRGWVSASQVTGMDGMTIPLVPVLWWEAGTLPTKPYTVRLYFAEMEDKVPGARVFSVKLQGSTVLTNLDVAAEAGGPRRELVKEFRVGISKTLDIDFVRTAGEPMLSGVELMADPEPWLYQPYAQTLNVEVRQGTPTRIGLVATDPDGAALTYQIVRNPANGTLSGTGADRFYTPASGFSGTDSFTYRVVNASENPSGLATVTITVQPCTVSVSPYGIVLVPGQTYDFTAKVKDFLGVAGYPDAGVTWTVSGGGTITPVAGKSYAVRLTAGATTGGPYVLTATYAGASATAEFYVTARPPGTVVLRGCGYNLSGQLGDGSVSTIRLWPVESLVHYAVRVAAGEKHSLAVKTNGTVWAWGDNKYGQLGDNTTVQAPFMQAPPIRDVTVPVQVLGLSGVTNVAAGYSHSLALKTDGTVWAWGYNSYGQLGDNSIDQKNAPVQVSGLSGVTNVAGGYNHSLAVKTDGTVWAWGYNVRGQLGDNTTVQKNAPVKVLGGLSNVTAVAAGYAHNLALKTDGTVWAWGWNNYGQLGDNSTDQKNAPVQVSGLSGVTNVAAGYAHSLALKTDGTVWAWGYNGRGQLGDNTTSNRLIPVQVSGLSNVTAVAAGKYHSLALKTDGTLWAWGYNGSGQLGDGTVTNRLTPVQVQGLGDMTDTQIAANEHSLFLGVAGTNRFTLTVNSGIGSGSYSAGTWVPISANAPGTGQMFDKWTGDTFLDRWTGAPLLIAAVNAAVTTFKMPEANAAITATYKAASSFVLTVNNGSGSGTYTASRPIAIAANAPPAGQLFGRWIGDTAGIADVYAAATTLVMPVTNATIRANYVFIANQPPTATPQSVSVVPNTAKAITLTGSDPEGSNLTYKVKEGGVK
jgi:alpha-tubulin suppressor-like RCC1 family protein